MTAHFQNLRRWATSFHFLEVEHGIFLQATFKMLWRNYDIWSMIYFLLTCWRDRHFWYLQGPDTGISYQVCLLSTVPSLSDGYSVWCVMYPCSLLCVPSVLIVLSCVAAEGWAAPSSLYPFVWCREGRGRWEEIHNKDQIKCLSDATENIWLSYWSEARGVGRQFHLWVHQPAGHPRQHRSSVIRKYILSCRKVFHYSFVIYLYSFLRML